MSDLIKMNSQFNIEFTLYKYEFDGISFNEVFDYGMKDEGFTKKNNSLNQMSIR